MRLSNKMKKTKCYSPQTMGKGWKPHHTYIKSRRPYNKKSPPHPGNKNQNPKLHTVTLSKAKTFRFSINLLGHKSNTCKSKENSILRKLFLSSNRGAITLSFSKISYVVKSMLNFNRLVCGCIHSWVLIYKKKQVKTEKRSCWLESI